MKKVLYSVLLTLCVIALSQLKAQDRPEWQLKSLGIDALHANGFTGKGVRIAVLDNGFTNIDQIDAFDSLKLIYQQDLVDRDSNVVEPCPAAGHCVHGTTVLSVLSAKSPDMTGAAPDAEILLFRTEDDSIEQKIEETYWAEAVRIADSLGVDIILSSLGYLEFDDGSSYTLQERDGKTAVASKAALDAARKGMLVVVSAGNEGSLGINVPGDADSILAVGSLNKALKISTFSSVGPTGDGRIKPDVVALGEKVFYIDELGNLQLGEGSSFSAPLIAGLAACLWQAQAECGFPPDAMFIRDAILFSADKYSNPNNYYGHGLPNAAVAYKFLTNKDLTVSINDQDFAQTPEISLFPNPSEKETFLTISLISPTSHILIEIFDQTGSKRLWTKHAFAQQGNSLKIPLPYMDHAGNYLVKISDEQGRVLGGKVWVKR
ncbi:MAG: S8 family peptidase [Bacteroidia bacterium]